MQAKDFYNYFRDCYRLDNREFFVDNLLSSKYKYRWILEREEELLYDRLPYIPYNHSEIEELEKDIELYKLEKKLFYGCFFVLGKSENALSKDKRICSPLLLYPAEIITIDDLKFLKIDKSELIINHAILSKLTLQNDSSTKDQFLEELENKLENHGDTAAWLSKLMNKYFDNQNSEELNIYPSCWTEQNIKTYFSKGRLQQNNYKIIPAFSTILLEKSFSSLRVLNDLDLMIEQNEFSTSIQELVSQKSSIQSFDFSYFQLQLNKEQYHALENVHKYHNSVLIGPPGTGKSYSIASIAADMVAQGKSVLIVSKTKQSVEVIREMLQKEYLLDDYIIHTTGHNYKASLKAKLRKYLSGMTSSFSSEEIKNSTKSVYNKLKEREDVLQEFIETELKIASLTFHPEQNLIHRIKKFFIEYKYDGGESMWSVFQHIIKLMNWLNNNLKYYVQGVILENVMIKSKEYRNDLSLYYDGLEADNFTEYKKIINQINYTQFFKVFPIWLANLADLSSVLPLQKEIFDLVIIDEATQCDIASALPAIYRAKNVLITGDPNQLRHYSFVSKAQQSKALEKYELPNEKLFDYRNRSILDVFLSKVQSQDQVTFLKEHFRSTPSLIEFSNQQFYDKQLEVMKSIPKFTGTSQIEYYHVEEGRRDKKGINAKEAEVLVDKLNVLITNFLAKEEYPSIGIISPFSSQVTYLNSLIRENYQLDTIKKFNLLCGTPYHFQGSEREIILMSLGVCDETHHSAFHHINKPEVLNVAITRAKKYQYVFGSIFQKLQKESLLTSYISFIKEFKYHDEDDTVKDDFQNEIIKSLNQKSIKEIYTGYVVAGNVLDLLIVYKQQNYFLDLIGFEGKYEKSLGFERYKMLHRTGIKCLPIHYSYWRKNPKQVIHKIMNFIKE